jgi:hypothetical protein
MINISLESHRVLYIYLVLHQAMKTANTTKTKSHLQSDKSDPKVEKE